MKVIKLNESIAYSKETIDSMVAQLEKNIEDYKILMADFPEDSDYWQEMIDKCQAEIDEYSSYEPLSENYGYTHRCPKCGDDTGEELETDSYGHKTFRCASCGYDSENESEWETLDESIINEDMSEEDYDEFFSIVEKIGPAIHAAGGDMDDINGNLSHPYEDEDRIKIVFVSTVDKKDAKKFVKTVETEIERALQTTRFNRVRDIYVYQLSGNDLQMRVPDSLRGEFSQKFRMFEVDIRASSDFEAQEQFENLNESTGEDNQVALEYDNLDITVQEQTYAGDYENPPEYDEFEMAVDYTFYAPKDYVIEELCQLVTDDTSDEEYEAHEDDWDSYVEKIVLENFDSLVEKYMKKLLECFEDEARSEAEEEYNYEYANKSEWDYYED